MSRRVSFLFPLAAHQESALPRHVRLPRLCAAALVIVRKIRRLQSRPIARHARDAEYKTGTRA
jgi:hypothetical protein